MIFPDDIWEKIISKVDGGYLFDCNKHYNSIKYYKFNMEYTLKYYNDIQFKNSLELKKHRIKLICLPPICDVASLSDLITWKIAYPPGCDW